MSPTIIARAMPKLRPRFHFIPITGIPSVFSIPHTTLRSRPTNRIFSIACRSFFQDETEYEDEDANDEYDYAVEQERRAAEMNRQLAELEKDLNEEKKAVLRLVLEGEKNVFFTGAAGTGKSFLLRRIIEGLEIKYLDEAYRCRIAYPMPNGGTVHPVGITASTGIAAYNINGITLHRFTGIGLGIAPISQMVKNIQQNPFKTIQWQAVRVLIIDEISMISAGLFNKLDILARKIRGIDKPFGGIQLVLSGDFFQLPPVLSGSDDNSPRFCFESRAWREGVDHTFNLTNIYRQEDPEFAQMLNEIRYGKLSVKTIETFKWLERPPLRGKNDVTEPVELYPLRRQAENANAKRMARLPGFTCIYSASEGGNVEDEETRGRLLNDCIAPAQLRLKKGAQVMLIKNITGSMELVNGAQGRVIGFASRATFYHHDWENNPVDFAARSELEPTIKEENETAFMLGDNNGRALLKPPSVVLDIPELDSPLYPVVRFDLKEGRYTIYHCVPQTWTVERWKLIWNPLMREVKWEREILASRTQVPLVLSWALSIHKAQGQSLDSVRVDLWRIFESGHAYVALSRARTIGGLQVLNFDPNKVYAHPKVKDFYDSLLGAKHKSKMIFRYKLKK